MTIRHAKSTLFYHSVHWGINTPSFLPIPPSLNLQTVQASSPFLDNSPLYITLLESSRPSKNRIFQ